MRDFEHDEPVRSSLSSGPDEMDFVSSVRMLIEYAQQSGSPSDDESRMFAWNECLRNLREAIIEPLMKDALACPQPAGRVLRLANAQLSQVFHVQALSMIERMTRRTAQQGLDRSNGFAANEVRDLLSIVDRVIRSSQSAQETENEKRSWRTRPIAISATALD